MHSSLPALAQYISSHSSQLLLVALFLLSWIKLEATPANHSVHIFASSSAVLWAYGTFRAGLGSYARAGLRRRLCWAAGAALALARLCEQASGNVRNLWWTKVIHY